jgi:hypothetical protein
VAFPDGVPALGPDPSGQGQGRVSALLGP